VQALFSLLTVLAGGDAKASAVKVIRTLIKLAMQQPDTPFVKYATKNVPFFSVFIFFLLHFFHFSPFRFPFFPLFPLTH
jgi:hypothetical protein